MSGNVEQHLTVVGCSFRTADVQLREQLAFDPAKTARALHELAARFGCEAVLLGTCNRVEIYVARSAELPPLDLDLFAEFLAEMHQLPPAVIRPILYQHSGAQAVRHLFRVSSGLDSLIIGEAQIANQVKEAFDTAVQQGTAGPYLSKLFQHARQTTKRVRTETGIAHGNASVSSVAVEYLRGIFSRFDDKVVLVIGAGKMGRLTLRALKELAPRHILVTNRTLAKAHQLAQSCGGEAVPFEKLDDLLAQADIILSTTGAPEPIVPARRYRQALARRTHFPVVIFDIAVPRDFDPRIHDGERTFLYNVDDLQRVCDERLAERRRHIGPAEAIIAEELGRFLADCARRRNGPVIARLTREFDQKRQAIVHDLFSKLNGKLSDSDRRTIDGAFRLLQNQLLHGPISALAEASTEEQSHRGLLEALRKLFRLSE